MARPTTRPSGGGYDTARSGSWLTILAIAVIAGLVVVALRAFGAIESLELRAHDQFVRLRNGPPTPQDTVTVIALDEADIGRWGWPLSDQHLAAIITTALGAGATAVAVDLYRDVPVPPGHDAFIDILTAPNPVVVAYRFGPPAEGGVPPPPQLPAANKAGFTDLPLDDDGTVRRGLLYLADDTGVATSLAMQAARLWLAKRDIAPRPSALDPRFVHLGTADLKPLTAAFGAYRGLDARGFQFLYDFRRPPSAIPRFSGTELMDGHIAPRFLRDRIVFVGVAAQSVNDAVTAPIAGDAGQRQTSGVLLHAYGADQIVRLALGQSSQTVAPSASVARLLVLAPAVAVGLAAVMGTTLLALAGAAVLVTIAVAVLGYVAFTADLWLPVVPMALSAVAAALVIIAYRSILERHRRLALASLLTSQVSPAIARQVWENRHLILDGKTPKPVRLTATVLFVDLAGSTTIADTAEPAVLVEWISRFLTEMAECVACHDGVIEKFTGDGLMAVFGVPVPRQTGQDIAADARNAAACALQMADRVEALNATAGEMGFPPTRCRIGIHSGPLSAGNVGTIDRMQYSVIGQTANLAARIEGYGKDDRALTTDDDGRPLDCRILLSGATADLLGDDVALRPIGPVQLRGAQTPIPLHRLLPTRADAGTANDPGEPDAKGS